MLGAQSASAQTEDFYTHNVMAPEVFTAMSPSTLGQLEDLLPCAITDTTCTQAVQEMTNSQSSVNPVVLVTDNGRMYTVRANTNDMMTLERYLPDGIYKTGNRVYLVQDGARIRLKKGRAYRNLRNWAARRDLGRNVLTYGMSNIIADMQTFEENPELCGHNGCTEAPFSAEYFRPWYGRLMTPNEPQDDQMSLYYYTTSNNVVKLRGQMNGGSFYQFAKGHAAEVSQGVLLSLPSAKSLAQ